MICQRHPTWSSFLNSYLVFTFGYFYILTLKFNVGVHKWSNKINGSNVEFKKLNFSAGINIFLDGFVPTENLRFRETSLVFKVSETATEEEIKRFCRYEYPKMKKVLGISKYNFLFKFDNLRNKLANDFNFAVHIPNYCGGKLFKLWGQSDVAIVQDRR